MNIPADSRLMLKSIEISMYFREESTIPQLFRARKKRSMASIRIASIINITPILCEYSSNSAIESGIVSG
jgi:hypothetical protein